jgi:hypothetical protein
MSTKGKTGCKASATAAASVGGQVTAYTAEDAVKLVSILLIVAAPKTTSWKQKMAKTNEIWPPISLSFYGKFILTNIVALSTHKFDKGDYQWTHHKTAGHWGLCTSRTRSNNYTILTSADSMTKRYLQRLSNQKVLARREEARYGYPNHCW